MDALDVSGLAKIKSQSLAETFPKRQKMV